MAEDLKMLAGSSCAPTVNSISLPPMLKRKRSDSAAIDAPVPTKVRTEDAGIPSSQPVPAPTVAPTESVASPVSPSPAASTTNECPPAQAAGTTDLDRLRDTITAQLSLEVLLKHNELRLIDQEIAKCQVALEQLRRCSEIPYPGSAVAGMSTDVSAGTGASVWAPGNGPPPLSPAPWGITEGPYSRHYARWLLPDPRFDGGEVESQVSATGAGFPLAEGRATRGNPVDFSSLAGKSRPSRNSTSAKLQALPSGYPVVKEKAGPMLIRRKSDGLLVKLVCLDCRRDNFSSTQGFINHCRIAHNRNFSSHEAAAVASGEPVEVDGGGSVIGDRTEATSSATAATPGYVHPLIRSSQLPTPSKEAATPRKQSAVNSGAAVATPTSTEHAAGHSRRQSEPVKAPNPAFLASPATPHLSALLRDRGLGLDLDKLVTEAKTPVDLAALSEDDSDADESGHPSASSRETSQQDAQGARQPMRMPTAQAASQRFDSRKGLERVALGSKPMHDITPSRPQYKPSHLSDKPSHLSDLSSLPTLHEQSHADIPGGNTLDHSADMSPHTVESNQAPSLVSDDDDYDVATDPESPSSSEADEHDPDFQYIEVEDDERSSAPSTASTEEKRTTSLADPTSQPPPSLAKPLKDSRSKKIMVPGLVESKNDDKPVNASKPAKDASSHDVVEPKSAPGS